MSFRSCRLGSLLVSFLLVIVGLLAVPARAEGPPVIYDVVEQLSDRVQPDFSADMATLIAAKALTGISDSATVYKRLTAEAFVSLRKVVPGIGVYAQRVRTQARRQDRRDNEAYAVFDYFARGQDAELIAIQTELAAEALLRTVDRLWQAGSGVYGAGEPDRSIDIVISPPVAVKGARIWESRAVLIFPVNEEETGLI